MSAKRKKGGPQLDAALSQRIGYRIFKERERQGVTAQVLAKRAQVHENTVYRAEQGLGVSLVTLFRIGKALGTGMDALLAYPQTLMGFENAGAERAKKAANVIHGTDTLF